MTERICKQCCLHWPAQSYPTFKHLFYGAILAISGNYRSKSYRKTKKHCFDQNLFDLGPCTVSHDIKKSPEKSISRKKLFIKKFVKSIFMQIFNFYIVKSSNYKPDMTPITRHTEFLRKNAQTRLLLMASMQNLASIGIELKVLRSVYVIVLVFYIQKSHM